MLPSPGTKAAGKGVRKETAGAADDFQAVKDHLVSNVLLFVQRAKEARGLIGRTASRFLRDGETVLTGGCSRVVGAVLEDAMRRGVRFRVVWVQDEVEKKKNESLVRQLREGEVPVAIIPASAVAYSMGMVNLVMVGAEGVVENGGIISRMGTYQLGLLAKSARKPLYVVAESHKFVRLYPLGQYDLPVRQTILDFQTRDDFDEHQDPRKKEGIEGHVEAVDYTPPELIKALVTEVGIHTPSAVSEELIKIWY